MPMIQEIDKRRNLYKNTLYTGRGLYHSGFAVKTSKAYYEGGQLLTSELGSGFLDLASIVNAGKTAAEFVQNNKDLIQTGVSTVGKIVDLGKSIDDTVKKSKEIEQIKELRAKSKKPKTEYKFTPEQEDKMRKLGQGFQTFKKA